MEVNEGNYYIRRGYDVTWKILLLAVVVALVVALVVATDVVSGSEIVAGIATEADDELELKSDFIGATTGVGVVVVVAVAVAVVDLKRLPPENNPAEATAGVVILLLPLLLPGRDGLAAAKAADF